MDRFLRALSFILLLFLTVSCTRGVKQPAKVLITPPTTNKVGKKVTGQLTHVVINIRDAANNLVMPAYHWDAECRECSTETYMAPPPGGFSFDLEPGPSYLVQAIAVYGDPNDSSSVEEFYYGDARQDLNSGANNVVINVTQFGASSGTEYDIAGRYLTANNSGPTGTLITSYQPQNSSPAMQIEESGIYNGWFSVFAIDGANLTYTVKETGLKIFDNLAVYETNTQIDAQDYRLHINTPTGYRQNYGENNSVTAEAMSAQKMILGYFGPDTNLYTSNKVCYPNTDTNTKSYTDLSLTSPMQFDYDNNASLLHIKRNGGVANLANCTNTAMEILMDPQYFEGWGGSLIPFDGPLKALDFGDYRNTFQWTYNQSSSQLTINWEYWMNAQSEIDGIEFFYADENNDGPDEACVDQLTYMNPIGFVDKSLTTFTVNVSSSELQNKSIVACTKAAGVYIGPIIKTHIKSHALSNPPQPANRLEVHINAMPITNEICTSVEVRNYENNSNQAPTNGPISYNLTATNGNLYTDMACTTPVTNPVSIDVSTSYYYFKTTVNLSNEYIYADAIDLGYGDGQLVFSSGPLYLTTSGPDRMTVDSCYQYNFKLMKANGTEIVSEDHPGYTITLSADANYSYYNNLGDCNGPTNAQTNILTIPTNNGSAFTYVRPTGSASGTNIIANITNGLGIPSNNNTTIGDGSQLAHHLRIKAPTTMNLGECYPISIDLENWDNVPVVTATTMMLDVKSVQGGVLFYNTSSCSTLAGSIYINTSQYSTSNLYMKATQVGTLELSASYGNLRHVGNTNFTANIQTPASGAWGYFGLELSNITLGDHNFPFEVPIVAPAGASFQCSDDYGATWGDCSGRLNQSSGSFTLNSTFFSTTEYRFRINANNSGYEFSVHPSSQFSGVIVEACTQVAASNTNMATVRDGIGAQANFTAYCIGENVTISSDATAGENITIGGGKKLLGYMDLVTKNPSSYLNITHNTSGIRFTDGGVVANIRVDQTPTSSSNYAVYGNAASSSSNYIKNMHFYMNGAGVNSPSVFNATDAPAAASFYIEDSLFNVTNTSTSYGIYTNRSFNIFIDRSKFEMNTTSGVSTAIHIYTPKGSNYIRDSKIVQTNPASNVSVTGINIQSLNDPPAAPSFDIENTFINTSSRALYASGRSAALPLNLNIRKNEMVDINNTVSGSPLVEIGDNVVSSIEDNIFDSVANTNRNFEHGDSSSTISRNIFRGDVSNPVVVTTQTAALNIDWQDNQFVGVVQTTGTNNFQANLGGGALTYNSGVGVGAANNINCSNTGVAVWTYNDPGGNFTGPATDAGNAVDNRCR